MATIYYESSKPYYRATQVVWYIAGVIEVILGLRFLLRLLGANPAAGFVDAVYAISQPLVAPFEGIVRSARLVGSVFDWNTLIAMVVYWILAWAIVRLFFIGRPVSDTEADYEIRRENDKL